MTLAASKSYDEVIRLGRMMDMQYGVGGGRTDEEMRRSLIDAGGKGDVAGGDNNSINIKINKHKKKHGHGKRKASSEFNKDAEAKKRMSGVDRVVQDQNKPNAIVLVLPGAGGAITGYGGASVGGVIAKPSSDSGSTPGSGATQLLQPKQQSQVPAPTQAVTSSYGVEIRPDILAAYQAEVRHFEQQQQKQKQVQDYFPDASAELTRTGGGLDKNGAGAGVGPVGGVGGSGVVAADTLRLKNLESLDVEMTDGIGKKVEKEAPREEKATKPNDSAAIHSVTLKDTGTAAPTPSSNSPKTNNSVGSVSLQDKAAPTPSSNSPAPKKARPSFKEIIPGYSGIDVEEILARKCPLHSKEEIAKFWEWMDAIDDKTRRETLLRFARAERLVPMDVTKPANTTSSDSVSGEKPEKVKKDKKPNNSATLKPRPSFKDIIPGYSGIDLEEVLARKCAHSSKAEIAQFWEWLDSLDEKSRKEQLWKFARAERLVPMDESNPANTTSSDSVSVEKTEKVKKDKKSNNSVTSKPRPSFKEIIPGYSGIDLEEVLARKCAHSSKEEVARFWEWLDSLDEKTRKEQLWMFAKAERLVPMDASNPANTTSSVSVGVGKTEKVEKDKKLSNSVTSKPRPSFKEIIPGYSGIDLEEVLARKCAHSSKEEVARFWEWLESLDEKTRKEKLWMFARAERLVPPTKEVTKKADNEVLNGEKDAKSVNSVGSVTHEGTAATTLSTLAPKKTRPSFKDIIPGYNGIDLEEVLARKCPHSSKEEIAQFWEWLDSLDDKEKKETLWKFARAEGLDVPKTNATGGPSKSVDFEMDDFEMDTELSISEGDMNDPVFMETYNATLEAEQAKSQRLRESNTVHSDLSVEQLEELEKSLVAELNAIRSSSMPSSEDMEMLAISEGSKGKGKLGTSEIGKRSKGKGKRVASRTGGLGTSLDGSVSQRPSLEVNGSDLNMSGSASNLGTSGSASDQFTAPGAGSPPGVSETPSNLASELPKIQLNGSDLTDSDLARKPSMMRKSGPGLSGEKPKESGKLVVPRMSTRAPSADWDEADEAEFVKYLNEKYPNMERFAASRVAATGTPTPTSTGISSQAAPNVSSSEVGSSSSSSGTASSLQVPPSATSGNSSTGDVAMDVDVPSTDSSKPVDTKFIKDMSKPSTRLPSLSQHNMADLQRLESDSGKTKAKELSELDDETESELGDVDLSTLDLRQLNNPNKFCQVRKSVWFRPAYDEFDQLMERFRRTDPDYNAKRAAIDKEAMQILAKEPPLFAKLKDVRIKILAAEVKLKKELEKEKAMIEHLHGLQKKIKHGEKKLWKIWGMLDESARAQLVQAAKDAKEKMEKEKGKEKEKGEVIRENEVTKLAVEVEVVEESTRVPVIEGAKDKGKERPVDLYANWAKPGSAMLAVAEV